MVTAPTTQQEKDALAGQTEYLDLALKDIRQRLDEIETEK